MRGGEAAERVRGMDDRPLHHPPDEAVTASDLARHFGHWQRRALQTPIYVLHHGRPQFVLASIEFMQALSTARPTDGKHDDVLALLDAFIDPVLICDSAGTVIAAGRAARLYFGEAARPGASLDTILLTEVAEMLRTVVGRVSASGIAERTQLPAGEARARLELTVEPSPLGVVLAGRDAGLADTRDAAFAHAAALASAIACLPGHALATIGQRGDLVMPGAALARLTGHSVRALAGMPAGDLLTREDQTMWRGALNRAFAGAAAFSIVAELVASDGVAMPVTIALAPLRRGLLVESVQAVLAPRP